MTASQKFQQRQFLRTQAAPPAQQIRGFMAGFTALGVMVAIVLISTLPAKAEKPPLGVCAMEIGRISYALPTCP